MADSEDRILFCPGNLAKCPACGVTSRLAEVRCESGDEEVRFFQPLILVSPAGRELSLFFAACSACGEILVTAGEAFDEAYPEAGWREVGQQLWPTRSR